MTSIKNCEYIIKNGVNKGKKCIHNAKINGKYCLEHSKKIDEENYDKCSVCYNFLKEKDICVLNCHHKFHLSCILKLYKTGKDFCNKCPLCRYEYTKNNNINNLSIEIDDEINNELPELIEVLEPAQPLERQRAIPHPLVDRMERMERELLERQLLILNILNGED